MIEEITILRLKTLLFFTLNIFNLFKKKEKKIQRGVELNPLQEMTVNFSPMYVLNNLKPLLIFITLPVDEIFKLRPKKKKKEKN